MPKRSRVTLTDKGIRSLRPSDRGYEVSDARLPGFGIRVSPAGSKSFFYRFRLEGARRRCVLGPFLQSGDLATARATAEQYRGLVLQGIDPLLEPEEKKSGSDPYEAPFGEVAQRWLREYARPNKEEQSWREDQRILEKDVLPHWRDRPVASLRTRDVRSLLQRILKRGGTMANRTHATIRVIFSWALEEGLIESNPAAIKRVYREKPPKTIVADHDLEKLWRVWVEERSLAGTAMCLYLLTGLRRDELKTMPWTRFQSGRFEIPETVTKNGVPHTVFLSRQALEVVEALEARTRLSGWLFPSPRGGGRKPVNSWNTAIQRFRSQAGVTNWSVQTLRRTAATILAREGVQPFVIDIFLNHVQGDVTHRHYVRHRYAAEVAEANQKLGDFVESLVGQIGADSYLCRSVGSTSKVVSLSQARR